jgi:ElaB/YqjD/DUF883 family membrane-anchored ribosome-binding protein
MAAQSKSMSDRGGMENLHDKAGEVKSNLQEMGSSAKQMAQEQWDGMRDSMGQYYEQGRERAMELEQSLEQRIRERPMSSLLIATGVGFLVGMMLMRK